jgi:hypothetical protein
MKARYLDILETRDAASILEAGLNATVRNVCQDGNFYLEEYAEAFFFLHKSLTNVICPGLS